MKMFNVMQAKEIPNRDKPIWLRIGKAFDKDGKVRIKLDVLPLPNAEGDVWLNLFEDDGQRKDKQDDFVPEGFGDQPSGDSKGLDDDIPF